jgi:putative chitinase
MGNSDEASQQGWLYRGRGSVQLTGKENYTAFSKSVNDPEVVNNPELVAEKYFFASAKFFFDKNKLWSITKDGIDDRTITKITKKINGGTHGLEDRIRQTKYYYDMIKS